MPTWIPDGRDGIDALATDLAALFDQTEQRLRVALTTQVAAALNDGADVAKVINLAGLRRDAARLVATLHDLLPDQIARLVQVAQESGALAAIQELADLADVPDPTTAGPVPGAPAAAAITADLTNALDNVTQRILRWPDDAYRRVIAQSATDLVLGLGATQASVQARGWQQLLARGITGFTDVAGRRWNLATYVEMASRTAARRAWDEQHNTSLVQSGVRLVTIAVGRGACQECADWAGKVLRIDAGPTGRITIPSATDPDRTVTVNVAATLDQARAHGWRHPNCRCRPVAYLPGLSAIVDVTTYDPDAEQARAKLRDLEVRVRRAKADQAAAVTPEQRRDAGARVRDLQGQIRDHVAEHGLMRQRNREQISLGHQRTNDGPTAAPLPDLPSTRRT